MNGMNYSSKEIVASMSNGFIDNLETVDNNGLRKPQYGALCSIRSYWTISEESITIVLPTGTGKSETMLATILSEKVEKTLIVVPNKLLRDQTYSRTRTWGILKDIGCLKDSVIYPSTLCLKSNFKDDAEFEVFFEKSNIIISTMSLLNNMNENQRRLLSSGCDLLVVDEAHHISSSTWKKFKKSFKSKKVLQFTATPYRQDGKLVDGKIIYNFPMSKAIEQDYFKPIQFISIEEYDDRKVDKKIAQKAVSELKKDIVAGFDHILLVRANEIKRAKELYDKIYSKYSEFSPVLITSANSSKDRKRSLDKIKKSESRIVVCVDMFGEGIDIPKLKIAALHDKFKSLPITLQFIGRFARSKKELGDAKVIANIADVQIMDNLKELYEKDADWNMLLPQQSETKIMEKISLQELVSGFKGDSLEIDLNQFRPRVSMKAYKIDSNSKWFPEEWIEVFDEERCYSYTNDNEKIMVVIEPFESSQAWSTQKNVESLNWNFYVVYWNADRNYICLNATDEQKGEKLLFALFGTNKLFLYKSEQMFRSLCDIKRLVLASVGLKSAIDGPVRYKMFAGIDVGEGISEANKSNCFKSNVFGMGYEGDGRISIGCSYKGKVWSRWVEDISFWKKWCDKVMSKILDPSNDSKILDNLLVPKVIEELPSNCTAYRIDFDDFSYIFGSRLCVSTFNFEYDILDCELRVGAREKDKQYFKLICGEEEFEYYLNIDKNGYTISLSSENKSEPYIAKHGKTKMLLSEYFKDNPPIIWYSLGGSLQGNVFLVPQKEKLSYFDDNQIISWDWNSMGVNIKSESQYGSNNQKKVDSIQYAVIQKLILSGVYTVIFDDDDSGEIADIIAFKEQGSNIIIEFYHCKYSKSEHPGARINDLYEVCGQAEKSVFWKGVIMEMIDRMKKRHIRRFSTKNVGRFELGGIDELNVLQKKLMQKPFSLNIFLVQPGVDSTRISNDMKVILGATSDYCNDTFSVLVRLICS